jgi:starch-binding outer membrane protein, SusD/RagB family
MIPNLLKSEQMKSVKYHLNIKTILALLFLLMWHSSCNDWIDIEPENELIKQEFWKTGDDLIAVMASTYDALRGCTENSLLMGEIRADFIRVQGGMYSEYERIGANDISTTNSKAHWSQYYNTINLANTVMYYAPIVQQQDRTLTNEILRGIEAEMLFIRSLSYFYLLRIWKDVPLVLTPTISDTVDFYLPKSPEHLIIKQLITDLKRASSLAVTEEYRSDPVFYKGRANKYAIQALLADVLLWDENYSECIVYCDSIINTGLFDLETNSDWFDLFFPGNSMIESLFEIQYDDNLENQENPMNDLLLESLRTNLDFMAFEEENDIRYCNGKGGVWKYQGYDETGSRNRSRSDFERDANFIYYRYSEILLMKAESLGETGNLEEANYLLRQVAERAGTTHTATYSLVNFRSAILGERGREFSAEGKRWFELLRFAKRNHFENKQLLIDILLSKATDANELAIMRTKVIDTMSYYLPIHHDELQVNKNLVQNPFYDR